MKYLKKFRKIVCVLVLFGVIFVARSTNLSTFTSSTNTNANFTKKLNLNAMTKVMDTFEAEDKEIAIANNKFQEPVKENKVASKPAAVTYVDATGYLNKPDMGFTVTTGNKTYQMTQEEYNVVAGVIGCEGSGENDRLAVASVIFNRADTGTTPYAVVNAKNQFSCIHHVNERTIALGSQALNAAQNGIRNNKFYGFNGRNSKFPYYIEERGNRFHY